MSRKNPLNRGSECAKLLAYDFERELSKENTSRTVNNRHRSQEKSGFSRVLMTLEGSIIECQQLRALLYPDFRRILRKRPYEVVEFLPRDARHRDIGMNGREERQIGR